jgi:hypothetical protein
MEFNIGSLESIAKRLGKSPGNKIHLQKFKQINTNLVVVYANPLFYCTINYIGLSLKY